MFVKWPFVVLFSILWWNSNSVTYYMGTTAVTHIKNVVSVVALGGNVGTQYLYPLFTRTVSAMWRYICRSHWDWRQLKSRSALAVNKIKLLTVILTIIDRLFLLVTSCALCAYVRNLAYCRWYAYFEMNHENVDFVICCVCLAGGCVARHAGGTSGSISPADDGHFV